MAIRVKEVSITTIEGARLRTVMSIKICMDVLRCWGSVRFLSWISKEGPWAKAQEAKQRKNMGMDNSANLLLVSPPLEGILDPEGCLFLSQFLNLLDPLCVSNLVKDLYLVGSYPQ